MSAATEFEIIEMRANAKALNVYIHIVKEESKKGVKLVTGGNETEAKATSSNTLGAPTAEQTSVLPSAENTSERPDQVASSTATPTSSNTNSSDTIK